MNFIKRMLILLALLPAGWGQAQSGSLSANTAAANRVLTVDASSMPLTLGRASLTIGLLERTKGVYTGNYKLKMFPYYGKLTVWFTVGGRKMIFEPAYHFAENATPMFLTHTIATNLAPPQFLVVIQKP